jgi:hypothetical protein
LIGQTNTSGEREMTSSVATSARSASVWLLLLMFALCPSVHAQAPTGAATTAAVTSPARDSAPFVYNKRWTTAYGPAYADILVTKNSKTSNMMSCPMPPASSSPDFAYALCAYSGPLAPTDKNHQASLPCTLSADKRSASCVCYKITGADYPGDFPPGCQGNYIVDVNAILNLVTYKQTVQVCKHDGSNCTPTGSASAPVCQAVDDGTLMPKTAVVSVFSFAMATSYSSGKPTYTQCSAGLYAGCMTAPCTDTGQKDAAGHALVTCQCPTYKGPYQIGEANVQCNANLVGKPQGGGATYVWSGSRSVAAKGTKSP